MISHDIVTHSVGADLVAALATADLLASPRVLVTRGVLGVNASKPRGKNLKREASISMLRAPVNPNRQSAWAMRGQHTGISRVPMLPARSRSASCLDLHILRADGCVGTVVTQG